MINVFAKPYYVIVQCRQISTGGRTPSFEHYIANELLFTENFIHQTSGSVRIFVTNLQEETPAFRE